MKFLTFYFKNHGGGLFKKLCEAIETLSVPGNEIHYFSTGSFPVKGPNIHFHQVPYWRKAPNLSFLICMIILPLRMILICKKRNIDTIFLFGEINVWFALPAKKINKTKLVTFVRGHSSRESVLNHRPGLTRYIIQAMIRKGILGSDTILPVSENLKNELIQKYKIQADKIIILPNAIKPVNIALKEGLRSKFRQNFKLEDFFVFGWAGTFKPVKRIEILINAFNRLPCSGAALIIRGKGAIAKELKSLAALNKNKSNRIIFQDWTPDITELICGMDLLVLPSEEEGCPSILLEATAWKTPCIGSNTGGIREILKDEKLLFSAGETEILSSKMGKILNDRILYDEIVKLNVQSKERYQFNWKDKFLDILNK